MKLTCLWNGCDYRLTGIRKGYFEYHVRCFVCGSENYLHIANDTEDYVKAKDKAMVRP